jgi:hypothetical protein
LNGQLRERQCWIALFNSVYDFSSFVREHPGGAAALRALAGSDGSEAYERVHPRRLLEAVGEGEQRLSLRELRELNARASGDGAAALAAFARQPLLPLPQLRVGTLMPADPAALPLPSPFPQRTGKAAARWPAASYAATPRFSPSAVTAVAADQIKVSTTTAAFSATDRA